MYSGPTTLSVITHVYRGMMCCIMGESQGMFSGRTWRWVSNPDPHPHIHPISILVPCDLHDAPQWHGSGPTTLSVMAHVYRGMHVLHHG